MENVCTGCGQHVNECECEDDEDEFPEPCQPIGCDNGYHLPGCAFAEVDAEEGGPTHA